MTARGRILLIVAALAAAALVAVALAAPRTAAAGYLLALTYAAAFPLGSLVWLMIHRLTGGRWGEALAPLLRPLSLATPLLLALVIPVLVATPILFPWAQGGDGIAHSVRLIYLNVPAYAIRSLTALAGLSLFALMLPDAAARKARLIAALGLAFYGIAITFTALDWMLAVDAPFFSTSFGASVAFTQLLAALALAAVMAPRLLPDLGALLLVVTLGITYIDFMAVLVLWYSDVPTKVVFLAERLQEPWRAVAVAAFILLSVVPVVLLLFARMRASRAALRLIGLCSLAGLALYQCWLLAPAYGVATLGSALLSLIAMSALIAAAIASGWLPARPPWRRTAHG